MSETGPSELPVVVFDDEPVASRQFASYRESVNQLQANDGSINVNNHLPFPVADMRLIKYADTL